ncbi:MAG: hypothetical protein JW751_08540 [Polyangiaceae bacterium]|nr:hypothetical protein [Polyangiaceae bacterium]
MRRLGRNVGFGMVALALALSGTACNSSSTGGGADDPSGKRHRGGPGRSDDETDPGKVEGGEATPDLPLPKAGVQGEENRSLGAEVSLTFETADGSTGGMSEKSFSLAEDRRVMVETVGEAAVTKVSVLYGKRETKGLEGWSPLPTENNGYTVEGTGSTPKVLQNGKNPAPDAEAKVVAVEYGYVGSPHPLLASIARSRDGGAQDLDAEGQAALLGYNPEIKIAQAQVTFDADEEVNGRSSVAVAVSLKGSLPDGTLNYEFDLTGSAHVDATTGWITDLSLQGQLVPTGKVKVKNRELTASGKGKISMKRTSTIK